MHVMEEMPKNLKERKILEKGLHGVRIVGKGVKIVKA